MAVRRRAPARPADAHERDPLAPYRAKRDFDRTPEPRGSAAAEPGAGRRFVVHKHAARRLHYDLRLELGGVLKSWAVTRGPSRDPADKRLAIRVEDHPLDYAAFEGTIPARAYGGGTVMLWDRGSWEHEGDPERDLAEGRLKFRLLGRKLRGAWTLVRMRQRGGERQEPWLLIKEADDTATPGDGALPEDDASAASGRTMAEIAAAERGTADPPPQFVAPQLAKPAAAPPEGEGWLFEIKHDGYRCQLRIADGVATVRTRGGHDWTGRFPSLAAAARDLPVRSALIDGEAVVVAEGGVSRFSHLRAALAGDGAGILCYAFDLLFLDGVDLRCRPLQERKERLGELLRGSEVIRFSEHVLGSGAVLLRHACELGAEGLIAKRARRPYRSGRGDDWLKLKCASRLQAVIGGFTPVRGRQGGLGALVLGEWVDGRLIHVGRVGTGWREPDARRILAALAPLRRDDMPFVEVPAAMRRGVRWVEPRYRAEVRFQERTRDGMLRHASWLGLREDPVSDALSATVPRRMGRVRLSSADRVMIVEPPTTKGDVWSYYRTMADWVLEGIADRPLSVLRCPSGAAGDCFFQRHLMRGMPKSLRPVTVAGKSGSEEYFAVDDAEGLLGLVQFGAVELHPWGVRTDRLDRPDRLVFDLDPAPGLPWARVVAAAHELRQRLEGEGLVSFPRTTGGKGLHLVVPIERRHGWATVKRFAAGLARRMAADDPGRYLAKATKAARAGRIFLDYLRNERAATAVASYSLRARPGATVAMPLAWAEVTDGLDPQRFTLATVPGLMRERRDPWAGFGELRQRLPGRAARA